MSYLPAPEDRFGADLADLMQRVRTLQMQVANLTSGAALDREVLTATAPSITLSVPAGVNPNVLRVAWTARSDNASGATYMCLRLNGDATTSYVWQINQANVAASTGGNSGAAVNLMQIGTMAAATATAGYIGSGEFVIPNASGNTYKAPSGYSNSANAAANGYSGTYGGLWLSTAAITSITLLPLAGSLVAGSTAYLYGMT